MRSITAGIRVKLLSDVEGGPFEESSACAEPISVAASSGDESLSRTAKRTLCF